MKTANISRVRPWTQEERHHTSWKNLPEGLCFLSLPWSAGPPERQTLKWLIGSLANIYQRRLLAWTGKPQGSCLGSGGFRNAGEHLWSTRSGRVLCEVGAGPRAHPSKPRAAFLTPLVEHSKGLPRAFSENKTAPVVLHQGILNKFLSSWLVHALQRGSEDRHSPPGAAPVQLPWSVSSGGLQGPKPWEALVSCFSLKPLSVQVLRNRLSWSPDPLYFHSCRECQRTHPGE